jgi:1,4-alpha-glucan branching enzyme
MVRKTKGEIGLNTEVLGRRVIDEYEWKYDNYTPLVSNEKLIIYELHIGDFNAQFTDVTAKIDYFVELGITAGKINWRRIKEKLTWLYFNLVEIMPIKEFPGEIGWGYTPRYYFAIESAYGTMADLKEMIDTFHENGIRVIIDGVYNHVSIYIYISKDSKNTMFFNDE